MSDDNVKPLPNLPDEITLGQAKAIVAAFGWKVVITPADAPSMKPGFTAPTPP